MKAFDLWENTLEEKVTMEYYEPYHKLNDVAIIVFPGGGYCCRAEHEGIGYAELLNAFGFSAFVVNYRVAPCRFPKPLLDARRSVQFVRCKAQEFGVDKNKILVMGSSAGGHLAALVATCKENLDTVNDNISKENYIPNGQILCYPVISSDESISHKSSYEKLLGDQYDQKEKYSPERLVSETTPSAFIWHTADDFGVSVMNSYRYAEALHRANIDCELHVFPNGPHGLGVAPHFSHVSQWTGLLRNWLKKYF